MTFTDAQVETLNAPDMTGILFNAGNPCECGDDADVSTRKNNKKYNVVYNHRCECGAAWSTWTEK